MEDFSGQIPRKDSHSYQDLTGESSEDDSSTPLTANTSENEEWECKVCAKSFLSRKECTSHENNCVILPKKSIYFQVSETVMSDNNVIKCRFCSKTFGLRKNRNRHEHSCSSNRDASVSFICEICGLSTKRKDNFKIHFLRCQEKQKAYKNESSAPNNDQELSSPMPANKRRTPCLHPDCDLEFYHKTFLIEHLRDCHNDINMKEPVILQFDSEDDFKKWKSQEEEETYSYFSQKSGQNASKIVYLYCQHDGSSHNKRKTSRVNSKGRIKVGRFCMAMMKIWLDKTAKKINVMYFPSHSHVCSPNDFVHHPVSEDLNLRINEKLVSGVSPAEILKDALDQAVPKSSSENQIIKSKAAVITKKRIRERARKMRQKVRLHKDEAKTLMMMLK